MLLFLVSLYINTRLFLRWNETVLEILSRGKWTMGGLLCDLGVAARVVRNHRILLVQEASGPHQDRWGLPKGHVDQGESPEQQPSENSRRKPGWKANCLVWLA